MYSHPISVQETKEISFTHKQANILEQIIL